MFGVRISFKSIPKFIDLLQLGAKIVAVVTLIVEVIGGCIATTVT
jgi:hypothetical protein